MRQNFAQPTASSASRSIDLEHYQQPLRKRQPQNDSFPQVESIATEYQSTTRRNSIIEPCPEEHYRFITPHKSAARFIGKSSCGPILMAEHAYRAPKPMGGPPRIRANVDGQPQISGSSTVSARTKDQSQLDIASLAPESSLPRKESPMTLSVRDAKNFFESKASQSQSSKPTLSQTETRALKGAKVKERVQKFQPSTLR